jgi:aminoglycoside 6'-N-acetyltransferase I
VASRYGLEIRAATSADAPGLSELLALCGHAVAPRLVGERLEAMQREPGVVLLAQEWGPPSGVIAVSWRAVLLASPEATITTLLVAPEARRRGIGRLLLKAGSQAARQAGCAELHLPVQPGQPELLAFCEAAGFSPAGSSHARSLRKRT